MAKKDPTDLTVEEKLKALYQLQTTLSAIDEKRALRVSCLSKFRIWKTILLVLPPVSRKSRPILSSLTAPSIRSSTRLRRLRLAWSVIRSSSEMVSNNREYDTLSKEIEFQELEIELCSKKIREAQQTINERLYDLPRLRTRRQTARRVW